MRIMPKIDPNASWGPLHAQAEQETDPRRKKLLQAVGDHMQAEICGRLDPLMDTLTAEPIYHFWGTNIMVLEGREAVTGFYSQMIAGGGNQFEVVVDNIIAGADHIVTEGQVKQCYTGKELLGMGMTEVNGERIASHDLFVTTTQLVTVWPGDAEGKLIGEDIYFGSDPFANIERIEAGDLPDYYQYEDRL
jgi:hypothetical protein